MIRIEALHKSFGGQKILDGVTLNIPQGEIFVLIGGSGEGKTVLLKHIIGLVRPDRGHIFIDDEDICHLRSWDLKEVRKKFGMLFQS